MNGGQRYSPRSRRAAPLAAGHAIPSRRDCCSSSIGRVSKRGAGSRRAEPGRVGIVIKQVEHIPNSNPPCLAIKSVNRDYDAYEVACDQINIVGRVVAAIRRM